MSERVPEGWRYNSIAECCEILDSQRIPLNSDERSKRFGEYPYYGANGIQGYVDDFIFDGDAILVAEDGGNFDQYAERPIAQWVTGKYWVNNHAHILRAKENDLDKWIFYSLVHKNILRFINGGTRAKLNQSDLREIQLYLPPLPEQKKIASILTSVDEVIETTQKQIDKLQDLKKATMNELLTKGIGHTEFKDCELGRIPKSWDVATINSVTTFIKSGLSRRLSSQDIGIPVINSGNILSRGLDTKELKYWYLDDPQGANIENYLLQDGDILLNFINSAAQIGKSCIFKSLGRDCIYTTNLFCIRVGNKISSSFLHSLMSQERFKKEISLITKPAVNQASFTKEDLSNIIILLPTLEEQNFIMKSLEAIDKNITNQHHKLETFQSLKKSLMQDLLTGKVRVQVN